VKIGGIAFDAVRRSKYLGEGERTVAYSGGSWVFSARARRRRRQ
jgi:hypothetical protein